MRSLLSTLRRVCHVHDWAESIHGGCVGINRGLFPIGKEDVLVLRRVFSSRDGVDDFFSLVFIMVFTLVLIMVISLVLIMVFLLGLMMVFSMVWIMVFSLLLAMMFSQLY